MELWQLRTFRTVAKTLHFTRASEELNLSQPAVSHQIKSLEKEVGERLFVRGNNGISMTAAGEVMLEHAEKILAITDSLREEIEGGRSDSNPTILLSMVSRGMGTNFLEIYSAFRAAHPEISLTYRAESDAASLLTGIQTGRIDIGILGDKPESKDFETVPYGRVRMQFVVGPKHPLAKSSLPDVSSLKNLRWGMFEPGDPARRATDEALSRMQVDPKSIFASNDGSTIRDLISAGTLVGFLPASRIVNELETGTLVNLPIPGLEPDIETNLIWKSGNKSSSLAAFVTLILGRELPGVRLSGLRKSADG